MSWICFNLALFWSLSCPLISIILFYNIFYPVQPGTIMLMLSDSYLHSLTLMAEHHIEFDPQNDRCPPTDWEELQPLGNYCTPHPQWIQYVNESILWGTGALLSVYQLCDVELYCSSSDTREKDSEIERKNRATINSTSETKRKAKHERERERKRYTIDSCTTRYSSLIQITGFIHCKSMIGFIKEQISHTNKKKTCLGHNSHPYSMD